MSRGHDEAASLRRRILQSDQCEATQLDVEAGVPCVPGRVMVPQEGSVGSITETSSVDSESCWGEMEDLIGEEKVEWGLLPCSSSSIFNRSGGSIGA